MQQDPVASLFSAFARVQAKRVAGQSWQTCDECSKGDKARRKEDAREGVISYGPDSDKEYKITFDDNGEESGHLKAETIEILKDSVEVYFEHLDHMPRDDFIRLCAAKLGDETRPVVIKAMRDERACQREVDARATRDLSSKFVMGIRDHYGGETFLEAAAQAIEQGRRVQLLARAQGEDPNTDPDPNANTNANTNTNTDTLTLIPILILVPVLVLILPAAPNWNVHGNG